MNTEYGSALLEVNTAFCAWMADVLRNFTLPADRDEGTRMVTVYDAFEPKVRRGAGLQAEGPELPFVRPRPVGGLDGQENGAPSSTLTLDILIAAERRDDDGYLDIMAIIDRMRVAMLEQRYFGNKRFRVGGNLEWNIQDAEAYPQWYGMISATIVVPQPVESMAAIDEVNYGEQV